MIYLGNVIITRYC